MKPSATAAAIGLTAVLFFAIGRGSKPGAADGDATNGPGPRPVGGSSSTASTRPQQQGGGKSGAASSRASNPLDRIPLEKARQLTSKERLELISKGALVYDSGKQTGLLCDVIATLTKEDVADAVRLLGGAQDRGNFCSQAVWDAIWTQWGRVDPEGVLKEFNEKPNGKSRADARHVMAGWWETDPAGALAWAKEPKNSQHDAVAASLALTNSAGGDPQKLEEIMAGIPAGDLRLKECLRDYLDLTGMKGGESTSFAQVYDQLPAALKDAAWGVILQRMSYAEPDAAADWLTRHASEPGYDTQASFNVVRNLANKDPKAAMDLAAALPDTRNENDIAGYTLSVWASKDLAAAIAWLKAQPADSRLVPMHLPDLEQRQALIGGKVYQEGVIWMSPEE